MKKLLLALMPLFLLSCSSDEPEKEEKSADEELIPITFDVRTEDAKTRAEAITASNFATDNRQFQLWAWMTDTEKPSALPVQLMSNFNTNALYGLAVTCQSGTWTIDPSFGQFYWPRPKYRVDFYAAYPYGQAVSRFNASAKTFDFTSTDPVPGNVDVMYATFQDKRESRDLTEKSRAVVLNFKHILSQVQFLANKSNELSVTIKSLEICNVMSQGTYTVGAIGTDTPSWDTPVGLTTYSFLKTTDSPVVLTSAAQAINGTNGILMLIPQERTKWNTSQTIATNNSGSKGCYLRIGCSIQMAGNEYSDDYDNERGYGYVYFPIDISWEAGKKYTYTLGFGTGYKANGEKSLTDITLSATVTDWVAGVSESESDIVI